MKKKGKFYALEGGEGAGKGTQIEILRTRLDPATTVFTREPGGTEIGEEARALIFKKERRVSMVPQAELHFFLGARAQLMEQVIRPALEEGKNVISDRFGLSTIAYQIYGRERMRLLPLLKQASREIVGHDSPTYFLLDIAPAIGKQRAIARGATTRFDEEPLEFYERVRRGYCENYQVMGGGGILIDGSESVEAVAAAIAREMFLD